MMINDYNDEYNESEFDNLYSHKINNSLKKIK